MTWAVPSANHAALKPKQIRQHQCACTYYMTPPPAWACTQMDANSMWQRTGSLACTYVYTCHKCRWRPCTRHAHITRDHKSCSVCLVLPMLCSALIFLFSSAERERLLYKHHSPLLHKLLILLHHLASVKYTAPTNLDSLVAVAHVSEYMH